MTQPESRWLTVAEAAAYARVDYNTALDWIHAGHLASVQLPARREDGGGKRRVHLIDRDDLDRLLEQSKSVPRVVPISTGTTGKARVSPGKGWHLKYR